MYLGTLKEFPINEGQLVPKHDVSTKKAASKITKIQIFSFKKEKCSSVWSYDKNTVLSDKNVPLKTE